MTTTIPHRGAAPVGYLNELDPIESGAVTYLRLWCDGGDSQNAIKRDFETVFGQARGRLLAENFCMLCQMCICHGRRPFMRHGVQCKFLGADENCFANFISYASEGAREDALMMAMTIVQPEKAHLLAGLAEEFGFALRKMALRFHPNVVNRHNYIISKSIH